MVRTTEKITHRPRKPTADDRRYAAVAARDKAFDGDFVYSVATTGVYCRPSCPSRHARRENMAFHASRREAEAAGFRPCKRCRPDAPPLHEQHARKIAEACRLIETAEESLSLDALAGQVGLSPYHFHRLFKAIVGVTPKAYAVAHRQKRLRDNLTRSANVTQAIADKNSLL